MARGFARLFSVVCASLYFLLSSLLFLYRTILNLFATPSVYQHNNPTNTAILKGISYPILNF
ncbi:hypothetical protein BVRB_2g024730 [Beta vulgaris subsp. vulgaris]|nr:hypothetical protein BVRB_2g024730 [Beta vulgaris subsp. vulgaris]